VGTPARVSGGRVQERCHERVREQGRGYEHAGESERAAMRG